MIYLCNLDNTKCYKQVYSIVYSVIKMKNEKPLVQLNEIIKSINQVKDLIDSADNQLEQLKKIALTIEKNITEQEEMRLLASMPTPKLQELQMECSSK